MSFERKCLTRVRQGTALLSDLHLTVLGGTPSSQAIEVRLSFVEPSEFPSSLSHPFSPACVS